MSKTHWKKLCSPDYLGAYSLDPGKDMTLTIKSVASETVTGPDNRKEECMVIRFVEDVKPMIVNVTNAKTITKLYKTPYIEEWAGCKITIFADTVKAFGEVVEALRIRSTVPKFTAAPSGEVPPCADCGAKIEPFEKFSANAIAEYNHKKYGKPLCSGCAQRRADLEKADKIADPLAAKGDEPVDLDNI